jgi:predicted RNA binding protein YcfA (HicA-like mRNA interferase family)
MPNARAEEFRRAAIRLGFERSRQTESRERWIHSDGRAVTIPLQHDQDGPLVKASPILLFNASIEVVRSAAANLVR